KMGLPGKSAGQKPGTHFSAAVAAERGEDLDKRAERLGGSIAEGGHRRDLDITAPATPEAEQWDGWGTALKPAFEPIVLARKPLAEKTVARNVLEHGTGAINIDATRIATGEELRRPFGTPSDHVSQLKNLPPGELNFGSEKGRWPANVLLDHHAAAWVDEQSGDRPGFATQRHLAPGKPGTFCVDCGSTIGPVSVGFNVSGGASRFFKFAESDATAAFSPHCPREFDDAFLYAARAPTSERPNVGGVQHPTVKPLAIMQ